MRFSIDYGKDNDDVKNTLIVLSSQGRPKAKPSTITRLLGLFACMFGIAMVLCSYFFDAKMLAVVGLVVAAAGIILTQQLTKMYVDRERATELAGIDTALYTGKRSYEVDDAGIRVQTGRGPRVFAWDELTTWGGYSHYLYARSKGADALLLVDANQMKDEQREKLEALLVQRVGAREVRA